MEEVVKNINKNLAKIAAEEGRNSTLETSEVCSMFFT